MAMTNQLGSKVKWLMQIALEVESNLKKSVAIC